MKLAVDSVVANFATTATDGKTYRMGKTRKEKDRKTT